MLKRSGPVTVDDVPLKNLTLPAVLLAVRPMHGCLIIYGVAGVPTFHYGAMPIRRHGCAAHVAA
jgi:hypothetical protein